MTKIEKKKPKPHTLTGQWHWASHDMKEKKPIPALVLAQTLWHATRSSSSSKVMISLVTSDVRTELLRS